MTPLRPLLAACLLLVLVATPAAAAPGDAVATGSLGSADAWFDDEQVFIESIAPCDTEGPPQGGSDQIAIAGFASYAGGTSECTIDEAGEMATADVTGGRFRLDALVSYGGPRLRLSTYTASCHTTLTGSRSWIQFSGLSGIDVPDELPANYEVTIPAAVDGDPPLATVTLNETIIPQPPDGSMTVNLMHVRLFPEGPGPDGGDVIIGSVHCAPVD